MLLHPSGWLTSHHKHLSNPQLGCKKPQRHENANEKKAVEELAKEAEEAEKPREQPKEQSREL